MLFARLSCHHFPLSNILLHSSCQNIKFYKRLNHQQVPNQFDQFGRSSWFCCCCCVANSKTSSEAERKHWGPTLNPSDSDVPASVVKGCPDMWLEFTCKCTQCGLQGVKVKMPNGTILTSTDSDSWKDCDERLSLYYNMANQTVSLLIKKLQTSDFGSYTCLPRTTDSSEEDEVTKKVVKPGEVHPQSDWLRCSFLLLLALLWKMRPVNTRRHRSVS